MILVIIRKNSYLNNYLEKLFCQTYYFDLQPNQDNSLIKHIKFEKRKEL